MNGASSQGRTPGESLCVPGLPLVFTLVVEHKSCVSISDCKSLVAEVLMLRRVVATGKAALLVSCKHGSR